MLEGATITATCAAGLADCVSRTTTAKANGVFSFSSDNSPDNALVPADYTGHDLGHRLRHVSETVHVTGGANTLPKSFLLATKTSLHVALTVGQDTATTKSSMYQCAAARPCR